MWVTPGPTCPSSVAGDDPDEGGAIGRWWSGGATWSRAMVLVAGRLQLQPPPAGSPTAACRGTPACARVVSASRRGRSRARGHPLGVTLGDDPAAPRAVAVLDLAVDHVGAGLEAAVRVIPGRSLRSTGGVLHRPHLVEQDERVGHRRSTPRGTGGKPRTPRPRGWCGGDDAAHRAGDARGRKGREAWQGEQVGGDGSHRGLRTVVAASTIPRWASPRARRAETTSWSTDARAASGFRYQVASMVAKELHAAGSSSLRKIAPFGQASAQAPQSMQLRIDVELAIDVDLGGNAVNRADLDAGPVVVVNARLRDDVGHGRLLFGSSLPRQATRQQFHAASGRLVPAWQYLRHSAQRSPAADTDPDMHRDMAAARWRATALLASIVGAAASAYLLVEYTTGQAGLCLTGSGCDLVRASAFAYPLGIPTPLIGLVFYLVAAWLVTRTLDARRVAGLARNRAAAAGARRRRRVDRADRARGVRHQGLLHLVPRPGRRQPRAARCRRGPAAWGCSTCSRGPYPARSPLAAQAVEGERRGLLRTGLFGGTGAALLVAVLLVAGAYGGGSPTGSPGSSGSSLAPAGSPHLGNGPVEVVEFADFQCPGCAAVAPILTGIASADEITLVSRYFPLESIHANANASARAAAAADQQGSFWQMSAALYARQDAWKDLSATDADAFFTALAGDLGLDVAAWQAAYASDEVAAVVDADRDAATGMGLNGTPTIYINGRQYTGGINADAIRAAIAAAAGS